MNFFSTFSVILTFLSLLTVSGFAKSPSPASKVPVSRSFVEVEKCFPELSSPELQFKVDLEELKNQADEKFVTHLSELRMRKVDYIDSSQRNLILTLRNKLDKRGRRESSLSLQLKNKDGQLINQKLTRNQSTNPKQEIINDLLLNAEIKSDESHYIDTKLNDISVSYRKVARVLKEYEVSDSNKKRRLLCEELPDSAIICTCMKK